MDHHSELSGASRSELAGYVERIESLLEEKSAVSERVKSEYTAAAGDGFDKKAIQQIIKERAADAQKSIEHRTVVETYRAALAGMMGTPLGDWARQWMANDERLKQYKKAGTSPEMSEFMKKRTKADDGAAHP